MELEEDEAQICRLCGQSESIYIDVFGEEGVKRLLGFKIHSKINILIKSDDGLPQAICMRCLGTLEFLCDFHSMCHNTQKHLRLNAELEVNQNKSKEKVESDEESNKENVLPSKHGKRKAKILSEKTKSTKSKECEEKISIENEIIHDTVEKSTDCLRLNPIDDKHSFTSKDDSVMISSYGDQTSNQNFKKEMTSNIIYSNNNSQIDESVELDDKIRKSSTSIVQQSHLVTHEIIEKKTTRSKTFTFLESKNRKNTSKEMNNSKKTIDKYFVQKSQYKIKSTNKQSKLIKNTKLVSNLNSDENIGKDLIFEGINLNDDTILMPLKEQSQDNSSKLNNTVITDIPEIVQAQEIDWIQNYSELSQSEKLITINSNQLQIVNPAPEDVAERLKTDETLVIKPSEQDVNLTTNTKQLIVVAVQLPSKENLNTQSKNTDSLKEKRSLSVVSSEYKYSEGRYAKISELMTDKQKKDIETLYSVDMTVVDELKVHKNVVRLDKCKFQCKICETIYPRFDKCQVHIWRHLDMKPYICKACEFSTLTISNIRCHIRKSHLKIKPFECHLCNKRYNSATLLEEHINIHTGLRPYQCNLCDFASTSKQVLAHHILIHKSKKDIICDICGKGFYSKGRMRAHQISHNKQQAFKCTLCSTYVLHEDALERHYMNIHTKDYVCKICNKIYKSRKALHNHESVHSDAKFECPMCPNVYKSTHILKEHILKHQGIRQYKCSNCNKSFAQQSHLAAHMAVHSDVTYNCPGCQKGFNRHDNMKVHAKRCDKFLGNPELQNLLTKRKISFSKNNTARVNTQNADDQMKTKKNREKSINNLKKIAAQLPIIKNCKLNSNRMTIVENVLSSKEY